MRKFAGLLAAVLVAGAMLGGTASSEPSARCGGSPVATGTDGAVSISVCVAGVGALTGSQQGQGGYIVVDGDSTNSSINPCLDGFAGVQVAGDNSGPVAEGEGDYSYPHTSEGNPDPSECSPA